MCLAVAAQLAQKAMHPKVGPIEPASLPIGPSPSCGHGLILKQSVPPGR